MNTSTRYIGSSKNTLIQQLMVMDEQIGKMEAQEIKVTGYTLHSSMLKWYDGSYAVYATYEWETTAPTFSVEMTFSDLNDINTFGVKSPKTGQWISVTGWKCDYVRRATIMRINEGRVNNPDKNDIWHRGFTAELTVNDLRSLYEASQMNKGSVKARED